MKLISEETKRNKMRKKGFYPGAEIKKEKGIDIAGNRWDRRKRVRMSLNETLRQAKRVDRFTEIKTMAMQVRDWYTDTFKTLPIWKWMENEIVKIFSLKGESNVTAPKAKRKKVKRTHW